MSSSDFNSPQGGSQVDQRRSVEPDGRAQGSKEVHDSQRDLTIWSVLLVGVIAASIFAVILAFVL